MSIALTILISLSGLALLLAIYCLGALRKQEKEFKALRRAESDTRDGLLKLTEVVSTHHKTLKAMNERP